MDDKVFDLLEKVYIELQETKAEVKSNSNHIMRLEDEFHNKFGALSDEVKILKDDVKILKDDVAYIKVRVDAIEEKVERHDIKIQVIEGGKSKKSLK